MVAVNPHELLRHWEGRGGRGPLSLRGVAKKLGVSAATVAKHLRALREAGQVDDEARVRALARRGRRRGGRRPRRLDNTDLAAVWEAQKQHANQRGTEPSIGTIARHLQVSRTRVRSRLQGLGLLSKQTEVPEKSAQKT